MAKSDRLFLILDELRKHRSAVTAQFLARQFEVSERTIYRDIETLRAGGALIDGEAGLGYILIEDASLPPQMFSRIEIEALSLALSDMRYLGDDELRDGAKSAFAKIVATLPDAKKREAIHSAHLAFRFDVVSSVPEHMKVIREAIWHECAIETDYTDKRGEVTQNRKLWPLAVAFIDQKPMLAAFCHLRQDFRQFHLREMENVRLLEESFRPRRVSLLREFRDSRQAR